MTLAKNAQAILKQYRPSHLFVGLRVGDRWKYMEVLYSFKSGVLGSDTIYGLGYICITHAKFHTSNSITY